MKTLESILRERSFLLDGGMGTQIFAYKPTAEDYGGIQLEGCPEILNRRRPGWIRDIHQSYLDAGADGVETNTFGCNELVLSEFGLEKEAYQLNVEAAQLAQEVARSFDTPKFVIGSVGPGTKLLTLGHTHYDVMLRSYMNQIEGLMEGGVDALLFETCQDLAQIKLVVRAAKSVMARRQQKIPIWVQATVETTGTLLVGSEMASVLTTIEPLGIDVLGINCATGPNEMHAHLQVLAEQSPFMISCVPNAGIPENREGHVHYPLDPLAFATDVLKLGQEFGINIVGGCCGTTPEHIRALSMVMGSLTPKPRTRTSERSISSLYSSVNLAQLPPPIIVGERTNANGSRKFKDLLALEDWEGLVSIAKDQQKEGAHLLDVCVAYVGRDEVRDMEEVLKRVVVQTTLPLMIDSTEVPVIERALQVAPGKCIVNSINFEDGEDRARQVIELCKTYGAGLVALTIDEQGMAKTREQKFEVARRLIQLAESYAFPLGDLIIDPLTFTLGSGDEEFRGSAIETLEAIAMIKQSYPEVRTILGVSNVSFGLMPQARHGLNALMLYHGVRKGLDFAIFNSAKVIPVAKIDPSERTMIEDLIFDRRREGYDPLKSILAHFSTKPQSAKTNIDESLPLKERIELGIIDGEKQRIVIDVQKALDQGDDPLWLINEVLLGAMKIVGERFGSGEMQLPFVLESAEAMKAAITVIEPRLPKESSSTKGRIILATVKGDVHDIGKNLVDIILSNNGFEVKNIGIKKPIEDILRAHAEWPSDAIGLSGLLVKSTVIMKENLAYMRQKGFDIPVILGGAALTRHYVETTCRETYQGPVYYASDAFEGLRLMQGLKEGSLSPTPQESPMTQEKPTLKIIEKGQRAVDLTLSGQSSWVRRSDKVPLPPFWGVKTHTASLEELWSYLDTWVLIHHRWGYSQGALSSEAFSKLQKEKVEPQLQEWKERLLKLDFIHPKARYGYFPVHAERENLEWLDPQSKEVLSTMSFPRQNHGRRLSIPDFFNPSGEKLDVGACQLVTLGPEPAAFTQKLYSTGQFSEYFLAHGLMTELTEAYAELLHAQIRKELGIDGKDASERRQLYAQGYQGSRFSFGYPACPDLEGNAPLLDLLDATHIGVELTESFQMDPEFSTSALIAWHPQARYFSV